VLIGSGAAAGLGFVLGKLQPATRPAVA